MKRKNKQKTPVIPGLPLVPPITPTKDKKKRIHESAVVWAALILCTLVCIAAEYILKLSGYRFGACPFWHNIALPFHREVKAHLLDLYISQISTTFIVTTFLSFLSDNKEPVYWTTLVEYKLINPKGKSLRDITWYCLGCLVTSFIALVLQATLAFLFSFIFSVVGLAVITCRMICIFFSKEKIKGQLRREFMELPPQEQRDRLIRLEENLISAVRNRDIACIRDDLKFLEFVNMPAADEIVLHFLKIIPKELYTLRLESAKLLTGVAKDIPFAQLQDREYLEGVVAGYDADIIIPRHEQDKLEQKTEWFKQALYTYVFDFLQENIRDGLLFSAECSELLAVFGRLHVHKFKDDIGMLMLTNSNKLYGYGELDFKKHFANHLLLLKQAYAAQTEILPYVQALEQLQELFSFGICMVRYSMYDTNCNYHARNGAALRDRVTLPRDYEEAAVYYDWEDTCAVFDSVCSLRLSQHNGALLSFLVKVTEHTDSITVQQGQALLEKVSSISTGDDEPRLLLECRDSCLSALKEHLAKRQEREEFLDTQL